MRRDLNRTCNILRASLWLALSWLVLVSPSFAQAEQWSRRDDTRQPAAQASSAISPTAARPSGDDGAKVALQLVSEADRPVASAEAHQLTH